MSEEILKALMQLFALIAKQGGEVDKKEIEYVRDYLSQQLNKASVKEHMLLFEEYAGLNLPDKDLKKGKGTSVKDSVKIFAICKKINRTLVQKQKVIVLVRLFELYTISKRYNSEKMNIIYTVSEVFAISKEDFHYIEAFAKDDKKELELSPKILQIGNAQFLPGHRNTKKNKFLNILWIESVDEYFFKHNHKSEVFLNGLNSRPGKIYIFSNGSSLRLQTGKPFFYSDAVTKFRESSDINKIHFEANNISFHFKDKTLGLRNISFSESQGKLVGIMGSSGSGKTTLLNVLCGIEKPSRGNVLINGINLHEEDSGILGSIGYIPQDDLINEDLTVYQNLSYSAKLCFKDKSKEEFHSMIIQLLSNLGLEEKKDLKVGSYSKKIISGGERKRLNIALELIREPSVLFVDEPTSGLSSRDSENVMDLLRELSLKGKLVFVVIHQPSSNLFKMFDNILLLDEGGVKIYYGNPIESIIHFKKLDHQINSDIGECECCGNVNQEIIFNIVEKKELDEYGRYTKKRKLRPKEWEQYFIRQQKEEKPEIPTAPLPSSLNIPGRFRQFVIFLKRDVIAKIYNRQYIAINLLEAPVLGFILAYIIHYIADPESETYIFRENENIPIYIFMSLIVGLFLALTLSAEEIYKDRKILKREKFLNLSRLSYLFAKISILLMISAVQAFLFVLVGNSILGIKGMYFFYWAALFSTSAFAAMLGLNISASFNSAITIYIIIPLLIIPMMVLSGAMFSFDKLNRDIGNVKYTPLIAELMATKWSYEALMVHQFKENKFEKYFYEYEKKESEADFEISQKIPALRKNLSELIVIFNSGESGKNIQTKFSLLRNEIEKYQAKLPQFKFEALNNLNISAFDSDIAFLISEYLFKIEDHYGIILAAAERKKDDIIQYMLSENRELYYGLKDTYYNERLADMVKKRFERHRILEFNDELIQQYHPIYQDPEPAGFLNFRSHFFSPTKHLFGVYFNTFWFNISVIWSMTLILFIFLYFDVLAKTISFIENIRIRNLINSKTFSKI